VAGGGLGQEAVGCAGAVEGDHLAAGGVGVAVVEVEDHGAGVALVAHDLKSDRGENAATGGAVGAVIGDRLGGAVRGDGEVYGAFAAGVVSGAKELSLRRVGVVGRSDGAGTAGGGHRAVDAAHVVDREVGEA